MIYISFSSSALGEKTEPSSLISEVQKIFVRNGEKIFIINDFFEEIAKEKLEEESYLDIQTYSNYEEELLYLVNNKNLTVKSLKDILQSNEKFLNKDLKNYIFSFPDDEFIRNILDKYFSPQSVEKIDCSKDLYFYKNNISASQIEKFYKCPFKFFFTSGLKLKENEKCEFDDRDIGNYFHHVSENFVKRNSERLGNMSEKEIEQELNKISQILYKDERFDRLTKCLKNKHMVAKLKNEALMLLSKVNYEQKWTDFVSKFVEKGFRCPIENTDFKLTGFIDRVDVSDKDFRVIDYKSGEIGQSLANVFYGVELQLFIYMIAIKNELGLKPAGAFYLPVGSDFAKDKSLKKLILSGFVLSENSILKKLDKRFNKQNLTSDIINLKLSASDGELTCSTKSKNVFTEDGLNSVMEYVKLLTKETINKMLEGKIWATPLKSKNRLECSNCEFYAICSFSGENNGGVPRQVSGEMKQEDFIDIIKGKEKNAGQI